MTGVGAEDRESTSPERSFVPAEAKELVPSEILQKLKEAQISSRTLSLSLAVSAVLVASGLAMLTWQNFEIERQNAIIRQQQEILEYRKSQIERYATQLASDVSKIPENVAKDSSAVAVAQKQATIVRQELGARGDSGEPQVLPEAPADRTIVVARGPSTGWDVDVFWCKGTNQDKDYAVARASAGVLSDYAANSKALAPGIVLGRVRLRPWPETMRDGSFKGLIVVSDAAKGEDEVRNVIANLLSTRQKVTFQPRRSVGNATPFYLSVFACDGWLD